MNDACLCVGIALSYEFAYESVFLCDFVLRHEKARPPPEAPTVQS